MSEEQWNDPVDRLLEKVTAEHERQLAGPNTQTLFVLSLDYFGWDEYSDLQSRTDVLGILASREAAEAVIDTLIEDSDFLRNLPLDAQVTRYLGMSRRLERRQRLDREQFQIEEFKVGLLRLPKKG